MLHVSGSDATFRVLIRKPPFSMTAVSLVRQTRVLLIFTADDV